MITLIFKSYFTILFSVGLGTLIVLSIGLYFIIKPTPNLAPTLILNIPRKKEKRMAATPASNHPSMAALVALTQPTPKDLALSSLGEDLAYEDVSAIAGDDMVATQLDLA